MPPETIIRICDKGTAVIPPAQVDSSIGVLAGGYVQELMSWSEEYQGVPEDVYRSESIEKVSIASESDAYYWGTLVGDNHNQAGDDNDGNLGMIAGGGDGAEMFDINTDGSNIFWGWLSSSRSDLACAANDTYCVFGGGYRSETVVDYFSWASQSDATVWGDHYIPRESATGTANQTIGLFAGGYEDDGYPPASINIESLLFASQANLTDWGTLDTDLWYPAAVSDGTQALFGGGYIKRDPPSPKYQDIGITNWVHTVLYDSGGQVNEFGQIGIMRGGVGTIHDSSVALWCGGADFAVIGYIDKQYFASGGQYTAFGGLLSYRAYAGTMSGGTVTVDVNIPVPDPPPSPNPTVGDTALIAGGRLPYYGYETGFLDEMLSGDISQFSYSSRGLCNEFGELMVHTEDLEAASNNTIGLWGGGSDGNGDDITSAQKSDMRTAANSTFWGNFDTPVYYGHVMAGNSEKIVVLSGRDTNTGSYVTTIQEFDTSSEGNSTYFGDLSETTPGAVCANEDYMLMSGMKYGNTYGYQIGKLSFVTGSSDYNWSSTDQRYNISAASDYDNEAMWGLYDPPDGIEWYKYQTMKSAFAAGYSAYNWARLNNSGVVEYAAATSNSQEVLFFAGYGYYGSYGPQPYIQSIDFESSVEVSWVGNVRRAVEYHAVMSDHAPALITCDIEAGFSIYSYFKAENLSFVSIGDYIKLFTVGSKDVQIEMDNCETTSSLDFSLDGVRKLKVTDSVFDVKKPLDHSHIKNLIIDGMTINTTDEFDIDEYIYKVNNTDIYNLTVTIAFDRFLDFSDINAVVLDRSFAKTIDINLDVD